MPRSGRTADSARSMEGVGSILAVVAPMTMVMSFPITEARQTSVQFMRSPTGRHRTSFWSRKTRQHMTVLPWHVEVSSRVRPDDVARLSPRGCRRAFRTWLSSRVNGLFAIEGVAGV